MTSDPIGASFQEKNKKRFHSSFLKKCLFLLNKHFILLFVSTGDVDSAGYPQLEADQDTRCLLGQWWISKLDPPSFRPLLVLCFVHFVILSKEFFGLFYIPLISLDRGESGHWSPSRLEVYQQTFCEPVLSRHLKANKLIDSPSCLTDSSLGSVSYSPSEVLTSSTSQGPTLHILPISALLDSCRWIVVPPYTAYRSIGPWLKSSQRGMYLV